MSASMNSTWVTRALCPARVDWSSPDDAFQILTVLSQLPLAICLPSELKQTLSTLSLLKNTKSIPIYKRRHSIQGDGTYLCPVRVDWHAPDSTSQILMVLSREPLARMLGFWGSKATQNTRSLLTNTKLELNYHRRLLFTGMGRTCARSGATEISLRFVP